MEKQLVVRGIAFENDVTKITVAGLANDIHLLPTLFGALAEHNINVDIIIQNQADEEHVNISFSITQSSLKETLAVLKELQPKLGYSSIYYEEGLAKVSIVGSGMASNPGVAAKMFDVLAQNNIAVKMVSTSEIKVSVVIDEDDMILAVEMLHQAFELSESVSNVS